MTTQRFLVLKKYNNERCLLVTRPNQPSLRFIIWKRALPDQCCPIHPHLGTPLLEGMINNEVCWLERTDTEELLKEYDPNKDLDTLFKQIEKALLFLHQCDATHGSIDDKHIGIRKNGDAVLIGIGQIEGSAAADLEALKNLKEYYLNNLQKEATPIFVPNPNALNDAPDLLLEVLHAAQRHPRDRPQYFEDQTQKML